MKVNIGAGFEAAFLDPVGQAARQRWTDAAMTVAFEELPPVSAFPAVPGRRWGPGLWWSATTGRHVAAGSNAMRLQLMALDRAEDVTGLAGRPLRLLWRTPRGLVRSWVPQLFARYADGTALLADCPSHLEAGGERARAAAQAVSAACEQIGWSYRRLAPLEDSVAANLKWLAGYRHPRHRGRTGLLEAVVAAFTRPRPLAEGVAAAGEPIEVLPVAFHALWAGLLEAAMDVPLDERVVVGPPGWSCPDRTGAAQGGLGVPDAGAGVGSGGRAGADTGKAG